MVFTIKENDLLPVLDATLNDAAGPVDLTGATVMFIMNTKKGGTPKVEAEAAIVDAPNGLVRYTWEGTDTDTPGTYLGEFEVTFPAGKLTFPNATYIDIKVVADLNSEEDVDA